MKSWEETMNLVKTIFHELDQINTRRTKIRLIVPDYLSSCLSSVPQRVPLSRNEREQVCERADLSRNSGS